MNRGLKICCAVSVIFLIIIVAIIIVLYFTLFKPKDPKISPQPAVLTHWDLEFWPSLVPTLNISLALTIIIDNPNYGAFKYENTTAYVNYHGNLVAEAPISAGRIGSRSKYNVTTTVDVFGDKVVEDPNFEEDFVNGIFNFTSSTVMNGKVSPFDWNMIKIKATSVSTCDISINTEYVMVTVIDSVCVSKIKF